MNPLKTTADKAVRTPAPPSRTGARVSIKCVTQAELERTIAQGTDARVDIVLAGDGKFVVRESIAVYAEGNAQVEARDRVLVKASQFARITAHDRVRVEATDNTHVTSFDEVVVHASGQATTHGRGQSVVTHSGNGRVYMGDQSNLIAAGPVLGTVAGDARCSVYDGELTLEDGAIAEVVEGGVVEVSGFAKAFIVEGGKGIALPGGTVFNVGGVAISQGGAVHEDIS